MDRIASPANRIRDRYDVIVVGSGYGAAVAASRLARAGRSVCVIERGREFLPGEFPKTSLGAEKESQMSGPGFRRGDATALYDFHLGEDINVLRGCGLGGTSLINANVSLEPLESVFADERWPVEFRADVPGRLAAGYRRAAAMLRPTQYPATLAPLMKLSTLSQSAAKLGEPFRLLDVNVNFAGAPDGNHVGVPQSKCNACGDCVTGCNVGAKNTTRATYLPDAKNHGAEIFCELAVRRIERARSRYRVYYQPASDDRAKFEGPELFVFADVVVLGAGALGSTEILLRSGRRGLAVSPRVGSCFSGNGDVLGFGYNGDDAVNGVGCGERDPKTLSPVGPCITGAIDARQGCALDDGVIIEEGVVPGALGPVLATTLAAAAMTFGRSPEEGIVGAADRTGRALESLTEGPYCGAVNATQTYLVMGHDGADGRMMLDDEDRLRIEWKGVGERPIFAAINDRLRRAAEAIGSTYVKNPTWTEFFGHSLFTVHPLGGCPMGQTAESGAVNHKGQVFASDVGTEVHDGLYVADGAIVPRSLGVNPLLTITASSERISQLIAEDRGWTFDDALPSAPRAAGLAGTPTTTGVSFTETMQGYFSMNEKGDYDDAYAAGQAADSPFRFVLTITADDGARFIEERAYVAQSFGTVEAPALSPRPLVVTEGTFNLFVDDPDRVDTKLMVYRMTLTDEGGKRYFFRGIKVIHDDPGFDLWRDTTTLFITLYAGANEAAPVVGKGVLRIAEADFAKQLATMRPLRAESTMEGLRIVRRFGEMFARELLDTYGGVAAPNRALSTQGLRLRRPLRAPAPTLHEFSTLDGVRLRLTRYQGGTKGPVILAPGFGNAASVYALDTVDTCFVEYLSARGYDVWLFDRRSSPALPSSATPFTEDDEARFDWPAAIGTVRQITRASTVQVVAHCMGSMTLLMATARGLDGVRNAICSQVTTYFPTDFLNRLKAHLKIADGLSHVGVENLNPNPESGLLDKALHHVFRLFSISVGEECKDPVCHAITGIFGPVYEHAQLNQATHDAMSEVFGVANVTVLKHLLLILGAGHAVDAKGRDVYRSELLRHLRYPIHFIAGAKNELCRPNASADLMRELVERFGPDASTRSEFADYAHLDCFVGKDAARDVFPDLLEHLDRYNQGASS